MDTKRCLKMNFKNFDALDIGLLKWSCIIFALFVVSAWPAFADWTIKTHWAYFLLASLMLAIKPSMAVFKR